MQPMNWYYAENGTSRGPHSEADMARLFARRQIPEDALVWHPGMSEWLSLEEVNPAWASLASGELPQTDQPDPSGSQTMKPAEKTSGTEQQSAASPVKPGPATATAAARSSEQPVASRLRPLAPSPDTPAEGGKKPGLLKRLFGMGKSKS